METWWIWEWLFGFDCRGLVLWRQKPHALRAARDGPPTPTRTSYRSPWQNGVAERWVQSCRRDLLDRVIVLNERHLKRLLSEYIYYYHEDRTHLGLTKETPGGRIRSVHRGRVIGQARLGGMHHRYDRAA
jgi:putative transposase